jgi:hypothetical protein
MFFPEQTDKTRSVVALRRGYCLLMSKKLNAAGADY